MSNDDKEACEIEIAEKVFTVCFGLFLMSPMIMAALYKLFY